MAKNKYLNDYYIDDYEDYYDHEDLQRKNKLHQKGKGKGKLKGHQSVHGKKGEAWDSFTESLDDVKDNFESWTLGKSEKMEKKIEKPFKKVENNKIPQNTPQIPQKPPTQITFGPNTHDVKGATIDFDRVENIEKVENEYNGRLTYGVKFLFTGKKGSSRVVWFSQNVRERDAVYNKEYGFWKNLNLNK